MKKLRIILSGSGGGVPDLQPTAFLSLAQSELMQGNSSACEQIKLEMVKRLRIERIHPPEELLKWYENLCDSTRVGLKK